MISVTHLKYIAGIAFFCLIVTGIISMVNVLMPHDDMVLNPVFNEDHSVRTRDAVTYSQIYTRAEKPQFTINETYVKAIEEEQSRNLTIHIPENATQNVTVWKGDRVVAYIPRET
jgi:hypothetical protein